MKTKDTTNMSLAEPCDKEFRYAVNTKISELSKK